MSEFLKHEALDRTMLIVESIESNLLLHDYISSNENLQLKVNQAVDLLNEVYQGIGETV